MAFTRCNSLSSIYIPESVLVLGGNEDQISPFYDCEKLKITVNENNPNFTSEDGILFTKNKERLLVYSGGVELESYTIPSVVKMIEKYAFYNQAIKTVIIPESVQVIKYGAFTGCKNLSNIAIGKDIASIGSGAFSATSFFNNENNWENGVLYLQNYLIKCKYDTTEVNIKEGTTLIADNAIASSILKVVMPDSLLYIGEGAFEQAHDLAEVTWGKNIQTIGKNAFLYCDSLTDIILPNSITNIEDGAFFGCSNLKTITIQSENPVLANNIFSGTSGLTINVAWDEGAVPGAPWGGQFAEINYNYKVGK